MMIYLLIYLNEIWLENIIDCTKCLQLTRHHFNNDGLTDVSVTVSIYRNLNDCSIWSDTVMVRIVRTKENKHQPVVVDKITTPRIGEDQDRNRAAVRCHQFSQSANQQSHLLTLDTFFPIFFF